LKLVRSQQKIHKKKKVSWHQLKSPRQRFKAASPILEDVGRFGEDVVAALIDGRVIGDKASLEVTIDVMQDAHGIGAEVKMCNCTHSHRPVIAQIARLQENVLGADSWLKCVSTGVYSLVFYNGIKETWSKKMGRAKRKSKIMSFRMGRETRRGILAKEMECVYFVDVALMNHLALQPEFKHLRELMSHAAYVDPTKQYRQHYTMLCLNRTFLRGFMGGEKMDQTHLGALESTYGKNGWVVEECVTKMQFQRTSGHTFIKDIPIRLIGSKATVKLLLKLVNRQEEISMNLKAPKRRKLVNT
jgi:hypothetical protein